MVGLDTSFLGAERDALTAEAYVDLMREYTREYFQRVKPTDKDKQSFAFFKQVLSSSPVLVLIRFNFFPPLHLRPAPTCPGPSRTSLPSST